MSLTEGVFEVISILENVIPPPFTVDLNRMCLSKNSLYIHPLYRRVRAFSNLTTTVLMSIITFRWFWLIFHWKSFTCHNVEQLIVYTIGLVFGLIYLPVYQLFRNKSLGVTSAINHACNLNPKSDIKSMHKLHTSCKQASIQDLFVFSFTFGFTLVLPVFFCIPFALPYLPLQLIFGSHPSVCFCAGILYSICGTNGAFPVLYSFLIIIVFTEQLYTFTATLIDKTSRQARNTRSNLLLQNLHKLRIAQVLYERCNNLFSHFWTNLIFVGVLLGSCGAFVTLKMYAQLNLISYMFAPTVLIFSLVVAVVFNNLFGLLYEHSRKFKQYWYLHATGTYAKKMIQACKPFGFQVGPYGISTRKLGIMICDDIVHCTVNTLLLA